MTASASMATSLSTMVQARLVELPFERGGPGGLDQLDLLTRIAVHEILRIPRPLLPLIPLRSTLGPLPVEAPNDPVYP